MFEEHRTTTVQLGCGTLLLIVLIVLLFGRGNNTQLENEVRHLRREVGELQTGIDTQTKQLRLLHDKLDAWQRPGRN